MKRHILYCDLCKVEIQDREPHEPYIDASNRRSDVHFHMSCFEQPENLGDVMTLIGVTDLVYRHGPTRTLYGSMSAYSSKAVHGHAATVRAPGAPRLHDPDDGPHDLMHTHSPT